MEKEYVHPLPVRIWHWANTLCFIVLILTGLQIRYVGVFDPIPFRVAVLTHNWVGILLIGNYLLWLVFYLVSDKKQVYHPILNPMQYFRESFGQIRFYCYGIFAGEPNPHHVSAYHKFNPLQLITYQVVMLILLPLQIYTGLLMWDVKLFPGLVAASGGVRVLDTIHAVIFIIFVGYILVHPYLTTMGQTPTAHLKAMVTGFEEEGEKAK